MSAIPVIIPAKQSGYYWRLIARECSEPERLRYAAHLLADELAMHAAEATERGLALSMEIKDVAEVAGSLTGDSVDDLRRLIRTMANLLEKARAGFRAACIWPPRQWEASEMARAVLG